MMKVKSESEKVGLKLTFKKLRSRHPIPLLHRIDGGKIETVADFLLGGSAITVNGDCSQEINRCCSLEEKP